MLETDGWCGCGISALQALASLGKKDLSVWMVCIDLREHIFNLELEELGFAGYCV